MPSLIDLRRRIRSVKNTQQITKAMKVVSAAKLRRAQDRVLAARPYAQSIRRMLANVMQAVGEGQQFDLASDPKDQTQPESNETNYYHRENAVVVERLNSPMAAPQ